MNVAAENSLCRLEGIDLKFPGADRPILKNINYSIQPGDRIILLGSNGSGKSSLLKLLNRTHQPSHGKIYFKQKNLQTYTTQNLSQSIVTFTQDLRDCLFFDLTVIENCLLWETRFQKNFLKIGQQADSAFFKTYLAEFHKQLPNKMQTKVSSLSGGERQSLVLGLCLHHPPDLLLLDEHTSALDPKIAANLIAYTEKLIIEKSITAVIATHNLDIALHNGNRLLALSAGEIRLQADGQQKQQLTEEEILEKCYL